MTRAQQAPPYNKLPEDERHYALFTDGSYNLVRNCWKWKVAVWSPTKQVVEGEDESNQFAELKAIQLALETGEQGKWTGNMMVSY